MKDLSFQQKRRISLIATRGVLSPVALNHAFNRSIELHCKKMDKVEFELFLLDFNHEITEIKRCLIDFFNNFVPCCIDVKEVRNHYDFDNFSFRVNEFSLSYDIGNVGFVRLFNSYFDNLVAIYNLTFDDSIELENRKETIDKIISGLHPKDKFVRG